MTDDRQGSTHVVDPQEAGINRSTDRRGIVLLQRRKVELRSGHEGLIRSGEPSDLGNRRVDTCGARLLGLECGRGPVPVGISSLEQCDVDHVWWVGGAEADAAGGLQHQRGVEGGDRELEVDDAVAAGRACDRDPPLQCDVEQAGIGAACQNRVGQQVAA